MSALRASHAAIPSPVLRLDGVNHVCVGRRRLVHFAGCDYLRLSRHPAIIGALREAATAEGVGPAASRMTSGNHPLYGRLEATLARFAGAESSLLLGSGYLTNLAVAQALAGEVDAVLIDEQSHPSLRDAGRLFGARVTTFRHRDPASLQRALQRRRVCNYPIVLTDGVFPLEGETAPLAEYHRLLPSGGWLLVDDAHGLGVMGRRGRGTPDAYGMNTNPRLLRTATLSKALGSFGGVILGPAWLTKKLVERSGVFRASTPLPLPCAAAAVEAIRLLGKESARIASLRRNLRRAKDAFARAGFAQPDNEAPILSVCLPDERMARRLEVGLAKSGIHARAITYPGDAPGWRFRFAISSEHTSEQIDRLALAVQSCCNP